MNILESIAYHLGAPEPALRLVISLLAGYPVAAFYHHYVRSMSETLRHVFFVVVGLIIAYFNYGEDVMHSMMAVFGTYIFLQIFGASKESVCSIFTFTMLYLLAGYYLTGTETYDIKWTMAQCVLTLRLIGLVFDIYDGAKPDELVPKNQRETALQHVPSLLEIAAHAYFPGSFLVGPQFPMRRYLNFVKGKYDQETGDLSSCWAAGRKRCALGFLYLAIYQLGSTYLPDSYLMSQTFLGHTFWKKCVIIGIWGKILLCKYICCWLISEGVCISFGLTFNGKTPEGITKWDGCQNVSLSVYENATKFGDFIASFNINTNLWVGTYIFRRLKFLGSRAISYAVTLTFLAVWHGLHSGYYACFFMEFVIMQFEREVTSLLRRHEKVKTVLLSPTVYPFVWVILKLYTSVFMGYSLVPFALLSFGRWFDVYTSLYFCGHIGFLSLILLCRLLQLIHI
ncbi:lysophospholipid acyltransferase 5-like [Schistocerca gregaria]|uniref:lysophospholipid acyltransferase 5-like n=1 Tax=Schistocerca gregaria TaxID=7010 RepID=UPI00211E2496|nr:lysophospholipid acyltransferase 5-like [Schistocerca gregaria]